MLGFGLWKRRKRSPLAIVDSRLACRRNIRETDTVVSKVVIWRIDSEL